MRVAPTLFSRLFGNLRTETKEVEPPDSLSRLNLMDGRFRPGPATYSSAVNGVRQRLCGIDSKTVCVVAKVGAKPVVADTASVEHPQCITRLCTSLKAAG